MQKLFRGIASGGNTNALSEFRSEQCKDQIRRVLLCFCFIEPLAYLLSLKRKFLVLALFGFSRLVLNKLCKPFELCKDGLFCLVPPDFLFGVFLEGGIYSVGIPGFEENEVLISVPTDGIIHAVLSRHTVKRGNSQLTRLNVGSALSLRNKLLYALLSVGDNIFGVLVLLSPLTVGKIFPNSVAQYPFAEFRRGNDKRNRPMLDFFLNQLSPPFW